jgi:hypothetical protein
MWGADYLSRLVSVKCQLKKGHTWATGPVFGHETADFAVSENRLIGTLSAPWCTSISALARESMGTETISWWLLTRSLTSAVIELAER